MSEQGKLSKSSPLENMKKEKKSGKTRRDGKMVELGWSGRKKKQLDWEEENIKRTHYDYRAGLCM